MNYIKKIKDLLSEEAKKRLIWLIAFSIFISVVETIGISAVMPFIEIATNFDTIHTNKYYQWMFSFFGFSDSENSDVNFAIFFGVILFGFYLFRGGMNMVYVYVMSHFSENLYAQITKKLFKTYLTMPYQVFTNKNSSYLNKIIITEAALMSIAINSLLLMISETFVIIFLYSLMLIANWKITLIFTVVLLINILFLTKIISRKIKIVGEKRERLQAQFYEIINILFGDFKQVKLQDKDRIEAVKDEFYKAVEKYAKVNGTNAFLISLPRLFIETVGFSLVIFLLITLLYLNQSNAAYILPTLSLFVLALYRLLPSVNRIMSGYNTILFHHKSIDLIKNEMDITQEKLGSGSIKLDNKIELINVNFAYKNKPVLNGITLTINKGDRIAFVGESGAGKSTLVDLIIGLYQPSEGKMYIDGIVLDESNLQNWRSQIGYIPQQVYLFDGTIAQNVCFGRKLDVSLLEKVLKQASIFNFLQTKEGIETLVGEGGIQLSGGQKQRIAIARAIYGQPEVLVLDEATSALDSKTEEKIMDEIYKISQNKTLIIIAHRISTVKMCDRTYHLKNGSIKIQ